MSKMVEVQVEKTCNLMKGVRAHLSEVKEYGYTEEKLRKMEADLKVLQDENAALDALLQEVAEKRTVVKRLLTDVKNEYLNNKEGIKSHFEQYEWSRFGLPDKR